MVKSRYIRSEKVAGQDKGQGITEILLHVDITASWYPGMYRVFISVSG